MAAKWNLHSAGGFGTYDSVPSGACDAMSPVHRLILGQSTDPTETLQDGPRGLRRRDWGGEWDSGEYLGDLPSTPKPAVTPRDEQGAGMHYVTGSQEWVRKPGGESGFDLRLDSTVIRTSLSADVLSQPGYFSSAQALAAAEIKANIQEALQGEQAARRGLDPVSGSSSPRSHSLASERLQKPLPKPGLPTARDRQMRQERTELVLSALAPQPSTETETVAFLGIQMLIGDLHSEDPKKQKAAAHELRMLAKFSDEKRRLIGEAGGIRSLAALLSSGDPSIVDEAVTAILNLSIRNENKRIMPVQGVIEPLVTVLHTGSLEARENAAATMFSLSVVDDNKLIIGASGAIGPLTELLKIGTEQGQRDACKALFNLSISSTNKVRIVEAGAVSPLVDYLQEPSSGMAEKSVSVLANLSTIPEGRAAIAQEDEGFPGLVEVVESGTPRGKENAAAALWQLASHCRQHRQLILQEVVIPPLVSLEHTGTPRARDKATQLLKNFREHR